MNKYFECRSSVVLLLLRKGSEGTEVLLQRRKNTGFCDGQWDFSCSGHVEKNETMTEAVVRECEEEIGVEIDKQSLQFVCLLHKRDKICDLTYYSGYFSCKEYKGKPINAEQHKCSEIAWFPIKKIPDDLMEERRKVLELYFSGERYFEYGW